MPETDTLFYLDDNGSCPLIDFLDRIPPKALAKCIVRTERLGEKGHELRRPEADYLRDKIYELRVVLKSVQYRMLYFFHNEESVISHGFIKEGSQVPDQEIEYAISCKAKFEKNPMNHTYKED